VKKMMNCDDEREVIENLKKLLEEKGEG